MSPTSKDNRPRSRTHGDGNRNSARWNRSRSTSGIHRRKSNSISSALPSSPPLFHTTQASNTKRYDQRPLLRCSSDSNVTQRLDVKYSFNDHGGDDASDSTESSSPRIRRAKKSFAQSASLLTVADSTVEPEYFVRQAAENLHRRLVADSHIGPQLKSGERAFVASDVVTWLRNIGDFSERKYAVAFMQTLLKARAIDSVDKLTRNFEDSSGRFRFTAVDTRDALESGKGSSGDDATTGSASADDDVGTVSADNVDELDLIKAIAQDSPGAVMVVLEHLRDAHGSLTDEFRRRCMFQVIKTKATSVAKVLIKQGFPVDVWGRHGDSLLHRAAYIGDTAMVRLLLDANADVHAVNDSDGTTPLFRASRLRNLGCAILLIEHGARIHVRNHRGERPVDLLHDLGETQRRLCTAVGEGLLNNCANIENLSALLKLLENDENDISLMGSLRKTDVGDSIFRIANGSEEAARLWMSGVDNFFARGTRRRRLCEHGMLDILFRALVIDGAIREHAVKHLHQIVQEDVAEKGDGCLHLMAREPLEPFTTLLLSNSPMAQMSAEILSAVSLFQPARLQLTSPVLLKCLLDVCRVQFDIVQEDGNTADPKKAQYDEQLVTHVVLTLSNIASVTEKKCVWEELKALDLLQRLLQHPLDRIRFFAARACAYLGSRDLQGVDILDPHLLAAMGEVRFNTNDVSYADDVQTTLRGSLRFLRAGSLEGIISCALDDPAALECHQIFLVHQFYFSPHIVFRVLTSRLHSLAASTEQVLKMPLSHVRIFEALKIWVETRLFDFVGDPELLTDLKTLIRIMEDRNDAYSSVAGKLLDTVVSEKTGNVALPSGVSDYSQANHHHLYDQAAAMVRDGKLPCPRDLAATLAAVRLYVADLELSGGQTKSSLKSELKNVLPSGLHKDREVADLVASEYARIAREDVSLRDAKHLFLDTCRLVAFEMYPVKLVTAEHKKLPRFLGIGQSKLVLLIYKNKAIDAEYPLHSIKSWSLTKLVDKGKAWMSAVGPEAKKRGTLYLMINVSGSHVVHLTGEPSLLQAAAIMIHRRVTPVPGDSSDRQRLGSYEPLENKFVCRCPMSPKLRDLDLEMLSTASLLGYPEEFARQLTLIEHTYFKRITPQFVIDHIFHQKAANSNMCDSFISHFNRITRLFASVIVDAPNKETRLSLAKQIVRVALYCKSLSNFNGVMECVSTLSSTPIRRLVGKLEHIFDEDLAAELQGLEELMSFEGNFRRYREALSFAQSAAVPYFGIVLKDITSMHHGNPNVLPCGLLNVSKWRQVLQILKKIEGFQSAKYNILRVVEVQQYILTAPVYDDMTLDERCRA